MSKLLNKLISKIGVDKVLHFCGGWIIFDINGYMLTVFGVAVMKEIYDEYDYGGFSVLDILATVLGGLIPYLLQI